MQRDLEALLDGAIGGAAGTVTLSAAMLTAERLGLMGEYPPKLIARAAFEALGMHSPSAAAQAALAIAAHFGFGIAVGALFAVLHRRLRVPLPEPVHGMLYATLVWVFSYRGWIPQVGVMPPPERDRPATRPAAMLLGHEIFGATLGAVVGLSPRRRLGGRGGARA